MVHLKYNNEPSSSFHKPNEMQIVMCDIEWNWRNNVFIYLNLCAYSTIITGIKYEIVG